MWRITEEIVQDFAQAIRGFYGEHQIYDEFADFERLARIALRRKDPGILARLWPENMNLPCMSYFGVSSQIKEK